MNAKHETLKGIDSWPVVAFEELFHVGSLNPADKRKDSQEGGGLSVSVHPEEWTYIAKLGGLDTHRLVPDRRSSRFLDVHAMQEDQKSQALSWLIDNGYLRVETLWKSIQPDEQGEASWTLHKTEQEALDELLDEDGYVEAWDTPVATGKAEGRCGFRIDPMLAFDIALTFVAEDAGFDGVWWNDELDVYALSAPRGVINLTSLPQWSAELFASAEEKPSGPRPY